MRKKQIRTDQAPASLARYSQGIRVGNTLYVQGMIALEPGGKMLVTGNIQEQTERVFENIRAVLAADGLDLRHVVRVVAFLAQLKDYPIFNDIYNRHFTHEPLPVRTTVQVGLPAGALVELEVTAIAE